MIFIEQRLRKTFITNYFSYRKSNFLLYLQTKESTNNESLSANNNRNKQFCIKQLGNNSYSLLINRICSLVYRIW